MSQPFSRIRRALLQGVEDSPYDLPFDSDNTTFDDKPTTSPWGGVYIFHNQPSAVTCGDYGEDAHDGIMQLDLNYPLGSGENAITSKCDELAGFFKAGKRLSYQGIEVVIRNCGRSRGRQVDGWWRVSVTVGWSARIPRN